MTEPGIVTWCEHGRPGALHCPDCTPPADRPDPDPTPLSLGTVLACLAVMRCRVPDSPATRELAAYYHRMPPAKPNPEGDHHE